MARSGYEWNEDSKFDEVRQESGIEKKKMEAAEVIEILKKQLAIASGGRDQYGRPIITISPNESNLDFTLEEIIHTLYYLGSLYDDSGKRVYFIIIIDMRKDLIKKLPLLLRALQVTLQGKLNKIILIRKDSIKLKLNVDLKKESDYLDCEILTMTITKLHQLISLTQLTQELNGSLVYDCDHWLKNRLLLERFVKDSRACIRHLQATLLKMNGHLQMMTKSNAEEMLLENQKDYAFTCIESDAVLMAGEDTLNHLEMDGDSGFRCDDNEVKNLDTKNAIKEVTTCLEAVKLQTGRLKSFWHSMETSLQQMVEFEDLEIRIHQLVDWILGPAEELLITQQDIGTSFQSADELRKAHEQIELACIGLYGYYAELRHKAEVMLAADKNHVAANAIEVQKGYMDTVCRSFANRLERRRNLLITSCHFHRLVQDLFLQFCNFFEVLQEDWRLESYDDCKRLLDTIENLHENITFATNQACREGEHLLDVIALPVKNASGQDVTPNLTNAVMHVKRVCAQLEERKKHVDEASSVRCLRIHQIAKIFSCEAESQQAIGWLEDLCQTLVGSYYLLGAEAAETEALEEQHSVFEGTAQQTYEYGRQLLHAALILRRSCKMPYNRNTELGRLLHHTWRRFLVGCKERSLRLHACKEFYQNMARLLEEFDNARSKGDKRLQEIAHHLSQVANTGKVLLERMKLPVMTYIRSENIPYDESATEKIERKIAEAERRLDEFRARVRRDSEEVVSLSSSSSSAKMESFQKSGSQTMVDDWRSLTSDEWRTAPSEAATSVNELDEVFWADENGIDDARDAPPTARAASPVTMATTRASVKQLRSVSTLKQVSRSSSSRMWSAESALTATRQTIREKSLQNGARMTIEREMSSVSSVSLSREIDDCLSPFLLNNEVNVEPDLSTKYENDPLVRQLKEVGEQICDMIDNIVLK